MQKRQFRRYRDRYEEDGAEGLVDRRVGKPSPKRVPAADARLMRELYGEVYRGWNVKHFHEHLVRDHGFRWGYTWVKTQLHTAAWDPHRSARSPWASRVRRKSSAVVVPFEQDVGGFRPDDVFVRTESHHPRHAVWETPGGGVSS